MCKNPRVDLLQVENDEGCEEELERVNELGVVSETMGAEVHQEGLEVSIHSLSGFPSSNTMRLMGVVETKTMVILVDSGSTNNFLDPLVAKLARSKVKDGLRLQVKVANGVKLLSLGKCEETSIMVQGNRFPMSFHILTLGGCDIVLRVQWLRTSRPII